MSELEALLKSYDYSQKIGLVDKTDDLNTRLLPIYHTSLNSDGKNIITINLRKDSTIQGASFVQEYEDELNSNENEDNSRKRRKQIVFPVSFESAARSGTNAPPHPLVDKIKYITKDGKNINEVYLNNLTDWIHLAENEKVIEFLNIIKKFLSNENFIKEIADNLSKLINPQISGLAISYIEKDEQKGTEKSKEIKLDDIYLDFVIKGFLGEKDVSVSDYSDLHKSFIDYTDKKIKTNGKCNISGDDDFIVSKHRGIIGNSKLISLSNRKEPYFGRFTDKSGTINIGRKTSEKAHLMLKYLLENENSSIRLSENQYLVTWFSEDIKNSECINIGYNAEKKARNVNKRQKANKNETIPANELTQNASQSFKLGRANYSEDSSFYCMIIEKINDGRTALTYFRELSVSELSHNLKKWESNNSWYRRNKETDENYLTTPSLFRIVLAAYGIERKGMGDTYKLELDNKKFLSKQYTNLVISIIEGKKIPSNIEVALEKNIRLRNKYKDPKIRTEIKFVSMAVLKSKRGMDFDYMLDIKSKDRSYLFGRLLNIYENIEFIAMGDEKRVTNAEKFWNTYLNKPATSIEILESKTSVYLRNLKTKDNDMYEFFKTSKDIVCNELSKLYDPSEINKPLDYKFLFGYNAQNRWVYGVKKGEKEVNQKEEIKGDGNDK